MPIKVYREDAGTYLMTKTETNIVNNYAITRKNCTCYMCGSRISKGQVVLGSASFRYCIKCIPKFLNNLSKSLDKLKEICKEQLTYLDHNYQEIIARNVAAKLSDNS